MRVRGALNKKPLDKYWTNPLDKYYESFNGVGCVCVFLYMYMYMYILVFTVLYGEKICPIFVQYLSNSYFTFSSLVDKQELVGKVSYGLLLLLLLPWEKRFMSSEYPYLSNRYGHIEG